VKDYKVEIEALLAAIMAYLLDRRLEDLHHRRLLYELGFHHDQGNLLGLLAYPHIEPTKNGAELVLHLAVITFKVLHCSKNAQGNHAFAAFTRVTWTQQNPEPISWFRASKARSEYQLSTMSFSDPRSSVTPIN
jgi:hypothetical protein